MSAAGKTNLDSMVSNGYDADDDPYARMRNERKKKGKNI